MESPRFDNNMKIQNRTFKPVKGQGVVSEPRSSIRAEVAGLNPKFNTLCIGPSAERAITLCVGQREVLGEGDVKGKHPTVKMLSSTLVISGKYSKPTKISSSSSPSWTILNSNGKLLIAKPIHEVSVV